MKRRNRKGLSLLEIVIGTIIMAVIAAMIAGSIGKMRDLSRAKMDAQNIERLNMTVAAYQLEFNVNPDRWLRNLYTRGYVDTDRVPTPYGGFYSFDTATGKVVNTYAPQ